jgi:hypothetical protein
LAFPEIVIEHQSLNSDEQLKFDVAKSDRIRKSHSSLTLDRKSGLKNQLDSKSVGTEKSLKFLDLYKKAF